jgi:RNA polymerase sigma-70 factor (ECF subfamily)
MAVTVTTAAGITNHDDSRKTAAAAIHFRSATNTAIDFLRRAGRVNFADLESLPEPVLRSHQESPEQRVLRAEHRDRLEAGLEVLTAREKMALLLRDVEDLPAEEVALRLKCSKATVRSHIANARVKLRRYMERKKI